MNVLIAVVLLCFGTYFVYTAIRAVVLGKDYDNENRSEISRDRDPIYFWISVLSQMAFAIFLWAASIWVLYRI